MSLYHGLLGARVELSRIARPQDRIARTAGIARLFAEELVGTVLLAPYGARALALHRSLPAWDAACGGGGGGDAYGRQQPRLHRGVCYVESANAPPRCTLDVYVPPGLDGSGAAGGGGAAAAGAPVVLFCHGGVWAAGAAWHYAPMAASLARLGVLAAVMQYSLYPDALVPEMADEVAAALTWVLDNAEGYGGDPRRVSLVGHSAGAQLCAMALLRRAAAAHAAAEAGGGAAAAARASPSPPPPPPTPPQGEAEENEEDEEDEQQQQRRQKVRAPDDPRMPARFVGVAGVYDIQKHYIYEAARGVHELSTMKRAVGGLARAAAASPSVVLGAALAAERRRARGGGGGGSGALSSYGVGASSSSSSTDEDEAAAEAAVARLFGEFSLEGEMIAHRIGFDRGSGHYYEREDALMALHLTGAGGSAGSSTDGGAFHDFPLAAAARLPPTVLMSSCTDVTVPWYESAEMFHRLTDAGVPAKSLVYNKVGHGDFVTRWPFGAVAASGGGDEGEGEDAKAERAALLAALPPYARDLARVVTGELEVDYVTKASAAAAAAAAGRGSSRNSSGAAAPVTAGVGALEL